MTTPTVQADARSRAKRTLLQGLIVDVLIAVAAALLAWLPDADLTSREALAAFGLVLIKTVLTAVASYVMRLRVAPSEG